jgi:chemotaxis protein histidine kinase CheA
MSDDFNNDSLMELYLFESTTLLDNLDSILLQAESERNLTKENINEVFRIMHTIKGSSAMMSFDVISETSHRAEDLFAVVRDHGIGDTYFNELFDLILRVSEFLENEVAKIQEGSPLSDRNPGLIDELTTLHSKLKAEAPEMPKPDLGRTLGGLPKTTASPPVQPQPIGFKQPEPLSSSIAPSPSVSITEISVPKQPMPMQFDLPEMPVAPEGGRILGIEETVHHPVAAEDILLEPAPVTQPEAAGAPSANTDILSSYNLHVHFNEGSKMENIRAYMLVNKLNETGTVNRTVPDNLENNTAAAEYIVENGFYLNYTTTLFREQIEAVAKSTLSVESVAFVRRLPDEEVSPDTPISTGAEQTPSFNISISVPSNNTAPIAAPDIASASEQISGQVSGQVSERTVEHAPDTAFTDLHRLPPETVPGETTAAPPAQEAQRVDTVQVHTEEGSAEGKTAQTTIGKPTKQNIISVDLTKLDSLLDLVGEIVINESMVTENSDLEGLPLDNFNKAARQLNKLTDELQDAVMSVRVVPVSMTFQRMRRIVRDMGKRLDKEAELVLIGENTEVDKTILDSLGDPIMHLVRNAMDHAIEPLADREAAGKSPIGHIVLSAQNVGGDVIISVSDDGRGLDTQQILASAAKKNLLKKPEGEYSEKEVFQLLMAPGFSTKEDVTEFSGRGVGLDVVKMNIEKIGGNVIIESVKGVGTNILMKIPLTLAIISCMQFELGSNVYSIPITNIRESFKASAGQLLSDPLGGEMIMLRGTAYPIIRLHDVFRIENAIRNIDEGILILTDSGDRTGCLLVDRLIGKFQVVVKPIPQYLKSFDVKSTGISGCTIMGNGDISLILDVQELLA